MKITFIGTSHGVPEMHRRCSSYMIEAQGKIYLIDMGTSTMESLIARGIHPNQVTAVFFTHPHGDHTNGLVQFADLLSWYFKEAKPLIRVPNAAMIPALAGWLASNGTTLRADLDIAVVEAGTLYDDGVLRFTAIPNQHCPNAYSYLIEGCGEDAGKTLLFTGDLKHPSVDFPEEAKNRALDLAVCETAHFSPKEFLPIWEGMRVRQVVQTHVAPRWHADLDEIEKENHPYRFMIAQDGMELEV